MRDAMTIVIEAAALAFPPITAEEQVQKTTDSTSCDDVPAVAMDRCWGAGQ